MLNGNVLSQLDASGKGIHLFWSGPFSWVYSPGGWNIQRRELSRRQRFTCDIVAGQLITRLRNESELRLPFGWLSYSTGRFDDHTAAEVFRIDLDQPATSVRMTVTAKLGFSYALYRGKIVAVVSPKNSGSFNISFSAPAIDAVISYFLDPQSIQYCVAVPEEDNNDSWKDVPFIVKDLQLPIAEADPSLHSVDEEFEKAKSRLLPGEDIDPDEFKQLANLLRITLKTSGYPRHIDRILLLRENEPERFEELNATTPLLSLISHPKWRRVMGLGWFDQDAALQPGQLYEYRVTGFFPLEDIHDRVYGFHTLPSGTLLPSCFLLGDLMLRFSQPPRTALAPGTNLTGKMQVSRRGIALIIPDESFWTFPILHSWSLVIDFPNPVTGIQLELQAGHSLEYEARDASGTIVSNLQALPGGEIVKPGFSSPVTQLRLKGKGFLFTIRATQSLQGIKPVYLLMPPVVFADTPLPVAPAFLKVRNLQEIAAENSQEDGIATSAVRSALGFQLQWDASLQNGLTYWPADELTPPPVESTIYQVEHKSIPGTAWKPVLPEENWIIGNRKNKRIPAVISQGVNLMQLFPEEAVAGANNSLLMTWDDVFDIPVDDAPPVRPLPALGTTHQYRIRAVDIIGRPSADWRESDPADLLKLVPPPVPVGAVQVANEATDFAGPNGVYARLLVKDAPDLTTDEQHILGEDSNVILLRWGWHKEQRALDPYTTEFRVYIRNTALDSIEGDLLTVSVLGTGRFEATFQLDSALKQNVLQNTFIRLGGYPFFVESHDTGIVVKMILLRRLPDENGVLSPPSPGHVSIGLPVGADRMQPGAWPARAGIVPLTASATYSFEFRNALMLTAGNPKDELWVGVSASDDQPYVDDKLTPVENRKGNESPIVPVSVQGRYHGRPAFDIPPPLEPVPRLTTREPSGSGARTEWDIAGFLDPGTLDGVTHIRLERVSAGMVFNSYRVTTGDRIMAIAPAQDQPDTEVAVPNPDDKHHIISALRQPDAAKLADQYLVYLAGSHPYRASFFEAVTPDPVPLGRVADTYLPQTNRYVYRIRAGNAAGLISAGDAMLKMVVRVPSLKPGPVPEWLNVPPDAAPGTVWLAIPPDDTVTHVILFYSLHSGGSPGPAQKGSLLRVANRPDLYPDRMLKFRTAQGDFAKQLVKNINDPDVEADASGIRKVSFVVEEEERGDWRASACTLTRDGMASEPGGSWRIRVAATQP